MVFTGSQGGLSVTPGPLRPLLIKSIFGPFLGWGLPFWEASGDQEGGRWRPGWSLLGRREVLV